MTARLAFAKCKQDLAGSFKTGLHCFTTMKRTVKPHLEIAAEISSIALFFKTFSKARALLLIKAHALTASIAIIWVSLEIHQIFQHKKFLRKNFSTPLHSLFTGLKCTAGILDPVQQAQERVALIRAISSYLEPSVLTDRINSTFQEVINRSFIPQVSRPSQTGLRERLFSLCRSPKSVFSEQKTYETLEKEIETAIWFTQLCRFKKHNLELDSQKKQDISERAHRKYPNDILKRIEFQEKCLKLERGKNQFKLHHFLGSELSKKTIEMTPPLITDLLSENPHLQESALQKTQDLIKELEEHVKACSAFKI